MSELIDRINFKYIYFRNRTFDKSQLMEAIDNLTNYFLANIKSSSPFIVFTAYNHIKTIITYYAIIKAGKIAVILDPTNKNFELTEILEDVDPSITVFLNDSTMGFDYDEEIIFRKTNPSQKIESDLTDVCTIAYTNAEDGFSKGAMLTHQNILSEIEGIKETRFNKKATVCALLPTAHLYGLVAGIISSTHSEGNCIIKELNLFNLESTISELSKLDVTHYYTLPSIYYLISKIEGVDKLLAGNNEFVSGGIKLPQFVFDSFLKKTNKRIREGYGLTECSPAVALNYDKNSQTIDTIGYELPGVKIKILDQMNKECKIGIVGEICVKGDMVFKGYYNHEAATKDSIIDNWFHTGDYGYKDHNGCLYFSGLKKNMINVAGNNVYPNKLIRLMKINTNVNSINITAEDSLLQGKSISANIILNNNSLEKQTEFKEWCIKNINQAILPKKWNFK